MTLLTVDKRKWRRLTLLPIQYHWKMIVCLCSTQRNHLPSIPPNLYYWCQAVANMSRAVDVFDLQGCTLVSIHPMLAAEQQCQCRPALTLAKHWTELAIMYKRAELPRPKSGMLATYSPVPICATMDGVDVKFEAWVVVDVFPLVFALSPGTKVLQHQSPGTHWRSTD